MKNIRRTRSSRLMRPPLRGMVMDCPATGSMMKSRFSTTLPLREKPSLKIMTASLRDWAQAPVAHRPRNAKDRQKVLRIGTSLRGHRVSPCHLVILSGAVQVAVEPGGRIDENKLIPLNAQNGGVCAVGWKNRVFSMPIRF